MISESTFWRIFTTAPIVVPLPMAALLFVDPGSPWLDMVPKWHDEIPFVLLLLTLALVLGSVQYLVFLIGWWVWASGRSLARIRSSALLAPVIYAPICVLGLAAYLTITGEHHKGSYVLLASIFVLPIGYAYVLAGFALAWLGRRVRLVRAESLRQEQLLSVVRIQRIERPSSGGGAIYQVDVVANDRRQTFEAEIRPAPREAIQLDWCDALQVLLEEHRCSPSDWEALGNALVEVHTGGFGRLPLHLGEPAGEQADEADEAPGG